MTDLSGAGARILLIGTATHRGPLLSSVPAVARTVEALRRCLIERCEVHPDQLRTILDPPTAQTMAAAIAEEAQRARSILFVYYIGHGLLGPGSELYLAAGSSDRLTPGLAAHQALRFSAVQEAVTACRAPSVVIVLDCCYSGRAAAVGQAWEPALALPAVHGMYVLGSAEQLALAPQTQTYTTFTGELINLLYNGDPRGPRLLTLDAAYDYLFRVLRSKDAPLPRRQAGDRSGGLVIAANPVGQLEASDEAVPPTPGPCPYPGLDAFGVEDERFFYGRERLTEELLGALIDSRTEPGPVILVGPSGSGKTSLLHAGLLARLRDGLPGWPGSAGWPYIVLRPGEQPIQGLAARLNASGTAAADAIRADPTSARDLIGALLATRPGERLILVVDQLEELFTLCQDSRERAAFLQALAAIARPPDAAPQAFVVLALRADFCGPALAYPEVVSALRQRHVPVGPMALEELRAAIEKPAATAGLHLDDGVADLILHELGATRLGAPQHGTLPLLSHALWATWQRRSGLRLTVAGYRATGGISQAIATTADAIYGQLDEVGRDALRKMLPRLVLVGDEMVDTARPLDRTVLLHGLSDRDAAEGALGRFVEARLVTLDQDTARISHEALLHAWPLFQEWIQADREWLRTHQRLAADARAWWEAGRDPALLYRGSRLAAVREQATRTTQAGELEQPLADFLDRSSREELRAGRRRNIVIAVLTILLLVATTGGLGAVIFQRQAIGERNRATARLVAAEAESLRDVQPGLSKQLSAVAYRLDPDTGSASVFDGEQLPGTLDSQEPVIDMALTRDGRVLAISTGTSIALWDTRGRALGRVGEVSAGPVALSSDGRLLAAGVALAGEVHPSGEVRLWNVKDPFHVRQIASLPADTSRVGALAISPDDRLLVAGTAEGAIRVWDIADPQATRAVPSLQGHTAGVDSVTFAPRERLLASSSLDHTVRLWDLTKLEQAAMVSSLAESSSTAVRRRPMILHRLAFSPVGPFLATVSGKGPFEYPQVWDISQHSNPRSVASIPPDEVLASCFNIVQAVAFSSSGGTLVESCESGAWLWQFVAAKDLASSGELPAHTSTANGAVLFSPERQQLLHATDNGVLLWEVTAARRPGALVSLPGPGGFNTHISFSGAGRLLMAVGGNDSAQLWDVTDPRRPRMLIQLPAAGPVGGAVALSPDGAVFAARGRDHDLPLVLLHSTSNPDGDPVATISDLDNGVASLAFSRDGRTLAVADNLDFTPDIRKPPTVKVYDIHDLAHPLRVAVLAGGAYTLAFSPNGHLLSAGGTDQLLGWNLTDRGHPVELPAHRLTAGSVVAGVAYRPDGALLAVGDSAKTVRMWRVDDDQLIGEPKILRGNLDASQLGFSGDGRTLAMIGNDPTFDQSWVELWRVDGDVPVFQARLARSSSLSLKTFAYSPDGRILATLGSQPDYVELWDTSPQHAASAICASAGDAISRAQWDRYVGNLPYQPPCAASTH